MVAKSFGSSSASRHLDQEGVTWEVARRNPGRYASDDGTAPAGASAQPCRAAIRSATSACPPGAEPRRRRSAPFARSCDPLEALLRARLVDAVDAGPQARSPSAGRPRQSSAGGGGSGWRRPAHFHFSGVHHDAPSPSPRGLTVYRVDAPPCASGYVENEAEFGGVVSADSLSCRYPVERVLETSACALAAGLVAQNVPSSDPTGLQPSGRTPSLLSALNTPRLSTMDCHTAMRTPKVASR